MNEIASPDQSEAHFKVEDHILRMDELRRKKIPGPGSFSIAVGILLVAFTLSAVIQQTALSAPTPSVIPILVLSAFIGILMIISGYLTDKDYRRSIRDAFNAHSAVVQARIDQLATERDRLKFNPHPDYFGTPPAPSLPAKISHLAEVEKGSEEYKYLEIQSEMRFTREWVERFRGGGLSLDNVHFAKEWVPAPNVPNPNNPRRQPRDEK